MGIITNTHRDPLGLPSGQVLNPNTPTPVHNWSELKKNAVVAAWLRAGLLTEQDAPPSAQSSQFVQPDKTELMAKLDALGVQYDKRSGVAKLLALLAEAEAKKRIEILHGSDNFPAYIELAEGKSVQLGEVVGKAHAASGLTSDAWNALPADERDALLSAEVEKLKAEA